MTCFVWAGKDGPASRKVDVLEENGEVKAPKSVMRLKKRCGGGQGRKELGAVGAVVREEDSSSEDHSRGQFVAVTRSRLEMKVNGGGRQASRGARESGQLAPRMSMWLSFMVAGLRVQRRALR